MLGDILDAAFGYTPPGRYPAQERHDFLGLLRAAERHEDDCLVIHHAPTIAITIGPGPTALRPCPPAAGGLFAKEGLGADPVNVPHLGAPIGTGIIGGLPNIDVVADNGAAGVVCGPKPNSLHVNLCAQRYDTGVDGDAARSRHFPAGGDPGEVIASYEEATKEREWRLPYQLGGGVLAAGVVKYAL